MALDVEAATALAFRLARSFDRAARSARSCLAPPDDAGDQVLGVQDRRRRFAYEAMECLGGNGYVEEGAAGARSIARCRSMPSGKARATSWRSILLRVLQREPDSVEAVLATMEPVAKSNRHAAVALDELKTALAAALSG